MNWSSPLPNASMYGRPISSSRVQPLSRIRYSLTYVRRPSRSTWPAIRSTVSSTSIIRRSATSSDRWAARSAVMSRPMPRMPVTAPLPSRSGTLYQSTWWRSPLRTMIVLWSCEGNSPSRTRDTNEPRPLRNCSNQFFPCSSSFVHPDSRSVNGLA